MTHISTRIEKRHRARAAAWGAVVCLALTGCGGDSGATRTSAADDDPCDALARFDNTFQSTVTAVETGNTNDIHASVAGLEQEYLAVQQALETQAPEQHEQITTAMTKLSNAVARLPRDAGEQRVEAGLSKQVTGVEDAINDALKTLDCPPS